MAHNSGFEDKDHIISYSIKLHSNIYFCLHTTVRSIEIEMDANKLVCSKSKLVCRYHCTETGIKELSSDLNYCYMSIWLWWLKALLWKEGMNSKWHEMSTTHIFSRIKVLLLQLTIVDRITLPNLALFTIGCHTFHSSSLILQEF